jgi:hypothetical protein
LIGRFSAATCACAFLPSLRTNRRCYAALVRARVLLILSALLVLGGCTSSPAPTPTSFASPPPLAQGACLVGRWTLAQENLFVSSTIYRSLGGLDGTTLQITPDGTATFDYSSSAPATGTFNRQKESLILRGTLKATLRNPQGLSILAPYPTPTLQVTPTDSHVLVSDTLDGKTAPTTPQPLPAPYTLVYSCSASSLQFTVHTNASSQLDKWFRTA